MAEMTKEQRREYNRIKQRFYRDVKRGAPPHHKPTFMKYTRAEEIFRAAGHCSYCGMLLDAEYHKKHPLVGCQVAARNDNYGK